MESSNGHLKNAIDQALLIRGSRDFPNREDYAKFVENVIGSSAILAGRGVQCVPHCPSAHDDPGWTTQTTARLDAFDSAASASSRPSSLIMIAEDDSVRIPEKNCVPFFSVQDQSANG